MALKTTDLDKLKHQTTNVYEIVAAMSRRAKEINEQNRAELEEQLLPFKSRTRNPTDETEADRVFPEQVAISVKYEKMSKPTQLSIDELADQKYTFYYSDLPARRK
ncbi:MAG: DNA-directed RNA polymerase subunit omega [Rhizobacter sp.]|nr:DNA-directed RNA polymerase subunit omega [Chlorobiales bacterium]